MILRNESEMILFGEKIKKSSSSCAGGVEVLWSMLAPYLFDKNRVKVINPVSLLPFLCAALH